jgi:hypothetical protein
MPSVRLDNDQQQSSGLTNILATVSDATKVTGLC